MDWKSLLKTFVSIIFGFALGLWADHCRRPPPLPFGKPGFGPQHMVDRFANDFQLDEAGKAQVEKIFSEQQKKVEALHQEVFPRFESIRNETRARIRDVLSSEQREKFDHMNAEMDKEMRRFPSPPGPLMAPLGGFGGPPGGHGAPPPLPP